MPPEVRLSVISEYNQGKSITRIAKKFGIGTSTVFRWVQEADSVASFSDRKAYFCSIRPAGREHVGTKGVFHTSKGDCWIPTDSTYEYARLLMLEADPFVSLVSRCKIRFKYSHNGKSRTYIPDLMVTMNDGSIIVEEIKPERFANDPLVLIKSAAASAELIKYGVMYRVITEVDLSKVDLLAAAESATSRQDPEYVSQRKSLRAAQKREAQRRYVANKKKTSV